jgi:hypothetical protein
MQDETSQPTFKLRVSAGYAKGARWADVKSWTIDVSPSDTLAALVQKLKAATGSYPVPHSLSEYCLAASSAVQLVAEHTSLPHPRLDATVAQNGLNAQCILRWKNEVDD